MPDGVRVDVVVVVCEPVYAATIGGARPAIDGTPPRGAAGTSLCGELFAVPFHDENVIITPGDMGGRMFNKIKPSEMFVILPFRFVGSLPALLGGTPDVPALMESIKPGFTEAREKRLSTRDARKSLAWDADVEELLASAPDEVRSFARPTLEEYAVEHGHERITMDVVNAQMDSVGMRLDDVLPGDGAAADGGGDAAPSVDEGAPVQASATVDVDAAPDAVWAVVSDVAGWSSVYPELKDLAFKGPLKAGAKVSFKAGPAKIKGAIDEVREPSALSFRGKGMGATSTYVFSIAARNGGSSLTLSQSMGGAAVRPMKAMLQKIAESSAEDWARAIAARAEGRA